LATPPEVPLNVSVQVHSKRGMLAPPEELHNCDGIALQIPTSRVVNPKESPGGKPGKLGASEKDRVFVVS